MRQPGPGWLSPVKRTPSLALRARHVRCCFPGPGVPNGTLPGMCRWFALVRNLTAPRVSRTLTTVVVSATSAEKKAPMVRMRRTRVCGTTAPFPRFTILLRATLSAASPPSDGSLASVPLARASHDCDGFTLQEEFPATCTKANEAKSKVTASTAQICHFDGCTCADTGWQFPICVTTNVMPVLPASSPRTKSWTRPIVQTRRLAGLASWVALLARSLLPKRERRHLLFSLGT